MGTRCDFYVGRGRDAEWLGSYPFDGWPGGMPDTLLGATDIDDYRRQVADYLAAGGKRSTLPKDGWPWPWENSRLTDYAYAFDAGKVWVSHYGSRWFTPGEPEPEREYETSMDDNPCTDERRVEFPDMTGRQATTFGPRSGVIVTAIRD